MDIAQLKPGTLVRGFMLPEPVEVIVGQRLRDDYWPYVAFDCATSPNVWLIRNPEKLGWVPVAKVEHCHVSTEAILEAANE